MVNSPKLTIAADGELWTSDNFTPGDTFRFGTLEFIDDCFGSLDVFDGGDIPRAVFVGMTRSEPDSLHTILETVEDEDITASDEGGSSGFPTSRECNMVAPPVSDTGEPPPEGVPAQLPTTASPLRTTASQPNLVLTLEQQRAYQEEQQARVRSPAA